MAGSRIMMVDAQIREEGLDKILEEAGFSIRQPGCSACLAMNDDKIPAGNIRYLLVTVILKDARDQVLARCLPVRW